LDNRYIMMQRLIDDEYFKTSDLALATILSLYYNIDSIDKQNPRKVIFVFKKQNDLGELIETYWKCELRVEPQAYFNQLKALKTRLYSGGNSAV
jgi:hypothetical protein